MQYKQNTILKEDLFQDELEIYQPTKQQRTQIARVSLTEKGELWFSAGFRDLANLRKYEYCIVGFKIMSNQIYIQFGHVPVQEALKITHAKNGSSRIGLAGLLRKYEIDPIASKGPKEVHKERLSGKGEWWFFSL